jgi:hypothetical protein
MLVRIFSCVPREKIWNPEVPGTCVNSDGAILSSSAVNVIVDGILLAVPVVKTIKLQMAIQTKLAVLSVFGTGLL